MNDADEALTAEELRSFDNSSHLADRAHPSMPASYFLPKVAS